MKAGWKETDEDRENIFWPSVADMAVATCIILVLFWISQVFLLEKERKVVSESSRTIESLEEELAALKRQLEAYKVADGTDPLEMAEQIAKLEDINRSLEVENTQLKAERVTAQKRLEELEERLLEFDAVRKYFAGKTPEEVEELLANIRRRQDEPPIIRIDEQRKEYRFESGSSEMGTSFIAGLRQSEFARLAGEIIGREEEGRVKVDTLEIIGHTDGAPLGRDGNLDQMLPGVLAGNRAGIAALSPGSNNDLGLLRALAVREQWVQYVESPENHDKRHILRRIQIRCYSAGQTIPPDTKEVPKLADFNRADPKARRIEMRLTRLME
jgi:hypothetical protein